ncbi:MAG: hypothetical protein AB7W06_17400 [Alphaproteobacteria bacterium]
MTHAVAHLIFEPPEPRGFTAAGLVLYLAVVGLIALGTALAMSRLARGTSDDPEAQDTTKKHPPG